MLTTILGFIVKYKTWFIYAGAGLAILFALRVYGNKQWEKGVEFGDNRTSIKLQKEYEQKWAQESKKLDSERERLQTAVKANENNRNAIITREAELARARASIEVVLKRAMEIAQASVAAGYQSAGTVPDADLVTAIRAISTSLERDRTSVPPK